MPQQAQPNRYVHEFILEFSLTTSKYYILSHEVPQNQAAHYYSEA